MFNLIQNISTKTKLLVPIFSLITILISLWNIVILGIINPDCSPMGYLFKNKTRVDDMLINMISPKIKEIEEKFKSLVAQKD